MSIGLVSVILNAHNSRRLIERPIRSVLAQEYTNWEIIVWDNASQDDLSSFLTSFDDPRIKYFYDQHQTSLYQARVNAISQATGEYIAFLDHDDAWLPEKLRLQVPLFDDPDVVLTCTDLWTCRASEHGAVSRSLSRTYDDDYVDLKSVLFEYRVGLPTVVARSSALRAGLPRYPPPYFIVEDMDLVCSTLKSGKLRVLHQPTAEYWVHDSNLSGNRDLMLEELESWLDRWTSEFGFLEPETGWVSRRSYELEVLRARSLLSSGQRWLGFRALPNSMPSRKRLKYAAAAALLPREQLRRRFSKR